MKDLKTAIAENIARLRREKGMTQLQLAEKLNYSDKAVSKWESGASVPDITVLYEISRLFGVSVDYLITGENPSYATAENTDAGAEKTKRRRFVITVMSACLVFAIATVLFVVFNILDIAFPLWLLFVYAAPVSAAVVLVLNSIWGNRRHNYPIISVLIWSLIAALYLTFLKDGMWRIFLIGIPAQIITVLWAGMTGTNKGVTESGADGMDDI